MRGVELSVIGVWLYNRGVVIMASVLCMSLVSEIERGRVDTGDWL